MDRQVEAATAAVERGGQRAGDRTSVVARGSPEQGTNSAEARMTETIAVLALVISALSFALSVYSVWRIKRKETPHAWAEVENTNVPNLYTATIYLKNPTQYFLAFQSVGIRLQRIPVDEKQDFRLIQYGAFRGR